MDATVFILLLAIIGMGYYFMVYLPKEKAMGAPGQVISPIARAQPRPQIIREIVRVPSLPRTPYPGMPYADINAPIYSGTPFVAPAFQSSLTVPYSSYRRAMSPQEFIDFAMRVINNPGMIPPGLTLEDHIIDSVVGQIERGRINLPRGTGPRDHAIMRLRNAKNNSNKLANALDWKIV